MQQNMASFLRVKSQCLISREEHYNAFLDFQFEYPATKKTMYIGTVADGTDQKVQNLVSYDAGPDTIVTRSNGWCDKG